MGPIFRGQRRTAESGSTCHPALITGRIMHFRAKPKRNLRPMPARARPTPCGARQPFRKRRKPSTASLGSRCACGSALSRLLGCARNNKYSRAWAASWSRAHLAPRPCCAGTRPWLFTVAGACGRHLLPKLHAHPIERASFAAAPVTAWLLRSLAGCIVASRTGREVSGTRTTRGEWIPQSRVTAQIGRSSRQSSMPVSA